MEEKLKKEKEEAAAEAEAEKLKEQKVVINDIENEANESGESSTAVEEDYSSSSDDSLSFTPIKDPVQESDEIVSSTIATSISASSDLPPIPKTVVEQERLEMIEINNDGTSGHLTHNI